MEMTDITQLIVDKGPAHPVEQLVAHLDLLRFFIVGGITFYLIELTSGGASWRVLRPYSAFHDVALLLVADGVALAHPVSANWKLPTVARHVAEDEAAAKLKAAALAPFLQELLHPALYVAKDYVSSFFLPIRVLVRQCYDVHSVFGQHCPGNVGPFLDPWKDGEALHPHIPGTHERSPYRAWESVPNSHVTPVPAATEKNELRAVLGSMAHSHRLEDGEQLLLAAVQRRLREVLNIGTTKEPSSNSGESSSVEEI